MALVYFDSSALVKLLIEEDGSEFAAELWDSCDKAFASRIAYPEVVAALAAAGRNDDIDSADLADLLVVWEAHWQAMLPVELSANVEWRAGQLAQSRALRGADAIHLASALALQEHDLILAAWDRRLREGARAEGIALSPPQIEYAPAS